MARPIVGRINLPVYTPRVKRKRRLRLDRLGRVRIPQSVLAKARLKPGDAVEVEIASGGVLLRAPTPPGLVWDQGMLVVDGRPSQRFADEVERLKQEDLDLEMRRCWPT